MGKVGTEPWRESGNDGEPGENGLEDTTCIWEGYLDTYLIEGIQCLFMIK